ncbi:MAG: hypothetical protein KAV18_02655, partial [Candidatus Omnitrophica bacterium]|nr:hypothetical protein [Candidatus Omnitrophota bacterium]
MKIKKYFIVLTAFLWLISIVLYPVIGSAQELPTKELVEIEQGRLYIIPFGADAGAKKGDIAEVFRDGGKIAELRLTLVLADSSMAEVLNLFTSAGISSSDTVKLSGGYRAPSLDQPEIREIPLPEPALTGTSTAPDGTALKSTPLYGSVKSTAYGCKDGKDIFGDLTGQMV